jgi:endoglucanase
MHYRISKTQRLMQKFVFLLFLVGLFASCKTSQTPTNGSIRLNSLGYTPHGIKKATLLSSSATFKIIDAQNHITVFKGKALGPNYQPDVAQQVYVADFTELTRAGTYYLKNQNGVCSPVFTIGKPVYDSAFYTAMRGFYLWRCGTEVMGVHRNDTFKQEACHLNDGWLDYTEFGNQHKDGTGGWHDAGDYGKYTVNSGITMGLLFFAWNSFESKLKSVSLDIPNTANRVPDFLKELKWETDWLLKMEYPDTSGRVSHKLTRLSFSGFVMPEKDTAQRYFTSWSTSATAHFAAVMAQAARYFKPYDTVYAQTCLDAASRAYRCLQNHPEYKKWEQPEFSTGGYQTHDAEARLWAAVELWETTGSVHYLTDFESRIIKTDPAVDLNWDWQNVKNLGVFTYLLSKKEGRNESLKKQLTESLLQIADSIVWYTDTDVYGRPFNQYYWGCNGTVARLASNLYVAFSLSGKQKYKNANDQIVAHLFGRNYYGRSYVTGLGFNPPMHPHDRRSGADNSSAPWPGYLVGGGHTANDWIDEEASYSHNEIAINWQASLVYALAFAMSE